MSLNIYSIIEVYDRVKSTKLFVLNSTPAFIQYSFGIWLICTRPVFIPVRYILKWIINESVFTKQDVYKKNVKCTFILATIQPVTDIFDK